MAACIPAQAALFLIDTSQSVVGDQTFDYSFTPTQAGTITVSLTDLATPVAFDFLSFEINQGATLITPAPPPNPSSPFSFDALANATYSLSVFAGSGAVPGQTAPHFFGKYNLTVSDAVPVPEPGVWLMMLGGIGLLGWMRLRKSESFS
jgi:hypothetical protein